MSIFRFARKTLAILSRSLSNCRTDCSALKEKLNHHRPQEIDCHPSSRQRHTLAWSSLAVAFRTSSSSSRSKLEAMMANQLGADLSHSCSIRVTRQTSLTWQSRFARKRRPSRPASESKWRTRSGKCETHRWRISTTLALITQMPHRLFNSSNRRLRSLWARRMKPSLKLID